MKNVNIYLVLLTFFFTSCAEKRQNIPVFSYYLSNDSIKKFQLNINKNNNLINFEYSSNKDSVRDLLLKYNLEKDFIIERLDTFFTKGETYNSKEFKFKLYQRKEILSHNRVLVFNNTYGLLANLAFGKDFILLRDSVSKSEKEVIYKKLFRNLNKISIK